MAIMSLLKIKGLLATAILCAAFCMPISMTSVRTSRRLRRMAFASKAPPPIAERISRVMHNPNFPNSAAMVSDAAQKTPQPEKSEQERLSWRALHEFSGLPPGTGVARALPPEWAPASTKCSAQSGCRPANGCPRPAYSR